MSAPVLRLVPPATMPAPWRKFADKPKKAKKPAPVPLTEKEIAAERQAAWDLFALRVEALDNADPDALVVPPELQQYVLDNFGGEVSPFHVGLAMWLRVVGAYRALHAAWVKPRKRGGPKSTTRKGPDLALMRFNDELGIFRNRFWGLTDERGKRHGSADPSIKRVMDLYSDMRDFWHKKSPSYKKVKAKENRRRNQLPHVIAKKKAWEASPEGRAWRANYLAEAKKKRAQVRADKKAQKEALKDV